MSRLLPLLFPSLLVACNIEVAVVDLEHPTDEPVLDSGEVVVTDETDAPEVDTSTADTSTTDPVDTARETAEPVFDNAAAFAEPGEHTFIVPANVYLVEVHAWGGGGAGGNQRGGTGGGGAFASTRVTVTPGEALAVWVAEGGVNQGDGGGASWLLRAEDTLLVAAGGGGGGSDGCSGCATGGAGGAGGGDLGQDGQPLILGLDSYCQQATGGAGATATAGGVGGTTLGTAAYQCGGETGTEGRGGEARGVWGTCERGQGPSGWHAGGGQGNGGGGAGGAGKFGGGSAGFIWTYCSGGGGGGSSWSPAENSATVLLGGVGKTPGLASADGAGQGGEVLGAGSDGRVELTY